MPPPPRTIEQLEAAKTRARDGFGAAPTRSGRDAALLRYLIAVAEALARHGRNLSSLPPEELAGWLEAAAEGLPGAGAADDGRGDAQLAALFRAAAANLVPAAVARATRGSRPG